MQNIHHDYFNIERRSNSDRREFVFREDFPLYDCDNFLVVKVFQDIGFISIY